MSYVLGDIVLWIYAYAGTIPVAIPVVFLLCGIGLTGLFAALSEFGISDRFDDHFLTTPQIRLEHHAAARLPAGGARDRLSVSQRDVRHFRICVAANDGPGSGRSVGAHRVSVAAIFLVLKIPVALPMATTAEWLAAAFSFAVTIGQCAYIGLFGSTMRKIAASAHGRAQALPICASKNSRKPMS